MRLPSAVTSKSAWSAPVPQLGRGCGKSVTGERKVSVSPGVTGTAATA